MTSPAAQKGQIARRTRTVTARDIELFTEMTGDRNPLHYGEELAALEGTALVYTEPTPAV